MSVEFPLNSQVKVTSPTNSRDPDGCRFFFSFLFSLSHKRLEVIRIKNILNNEGL